MIRQCSRQLEYCSERPEGFVSENRLSFPAAFCHPDRLKDFDECGQREECSVIRRNSLVHDQPSDATGYSVFTGIALNLGRQERNYMLKTANLRPALFGCLESREFLALSCCVVCILLYWPGINSPFFTTGEPREATVAQSMYLSGDLLHAVRYGDDFATKPPLLHWSMVAASRMLGRLSETSSRLPSLAAATLTLLLWVLVVSKFFDRRTTLSFAMILGSAPLWLVNASHARVDMLLSCCVGLTLITLFYWSHSQNLKWFLCSTVLMGMAALTKGPVGIVLPLTVAILSMLFRRTLSVRDLLMLASMALLASLPLISWYGAQLFYENAATLETAFEENIARLFGTMSQSKDPHEHSFFYIIRSLVTGFLPWSLFGLIGIHRSWKEGWISPATIEARQFIEWCSVAVLVWLLVFCIPASKRDVYLLPIYPCLALLIAWQVQHVWDSSLTKRLSRILLMSLGVLWSLACLIRLDFLQVASFFPSGKLQSQIGFYLEACALSLHNTPWSLWIVQLLPLLIIALVLRKNLVAPLPSLAVNILAFTLAAKAGVYTPLAEKLTPKEFIAEELEAHRPTTISLASDRMYAEVFYIRQLAPALEISDYSSDSSWIFLFDRDLKELPEPSYSHSSKSYVKKYGRHLVFAHTSKQANIKNQERPEMNRENVKQKVS